MKVFKMNILAVKSVKRQYFFSVSRGDKFPLKFAFQQ